MKLLFVGCGNIGKPILDFIIKSSLFSKIDVIDTSFKEERIDQNTRYLKKIDSNSEYYDCLFIAIKPQIFNQENMKDYEKMNFNLVLSIMAGKTMNFIKNVFGPNQKVARIMPNMGVTSGNSYSLVDWDENCSNNDIELVKKISSLFGKYTAIKEEFFDISTILSSCMPALIYQFANTLKESALNSKFSTGLNDEQATEMIINGILCGAENIKSNPGESLDELTSKICSKGGMTEVGVNILSSDKASEICSEIISKIMERAKKL